MHPSQACVTHCTGGNTIKAPPLLHRRMSTCFFFFLLHYTAPILELHMKPDNEAAVAALFDLLASEPAERWHRSNRPLNLPSNGAGEWRYYIR